MEKHQQIVRNEARKTHDRKRDEVISERKRKEAKGRKEGKRGEE